MRVIRSKDFTATRAWGADDIANMGGFVVLDGTVDMHYRESGVEHVVALTVGDVFFAEVKCEHVAHPRGEARILVIEREGSV